MSSSRKSTRYAVVGFLLITVVVLGGMSWATVQTWRLAKLDVEDQRERMRREALLRMDSFIGAILAQEAAREYDDYRALGPPDLLLTRDLEEVPPEEFLKVSPIAIDGPDYEWIELYFQADHHGHWWSPQVPEGTGRWAEVFSKDPQAIQEAQARLDWLMASLPLEKLHRTTAGTPRGPAPNGRGPAPSPHSRRVAGASPPSVKKQRLPQAQPSDYVRRQSALQQMQDRSVPSPKCVPQSVADIKLTKVPTDLRPEPPDNVCPADVESAVSVTTLRPLWIPGHPPDEPKLIFVRQVYVDEHLVYQGFVVNWVGLKAELLGHVRHIFEDADLTPVSAAWNGHPDDASTAMTQVPARLVVHDPGPSTAALAWQSVSPVLVASWLAATAVLALAGLGVRNLVALTERRLQFAYSVTHELRTPLTAFRLYTDMLAAGLVPAESRQEYLETLNREAERLSTLVESVLEYARLENHKVRLNPVSIRAEALLQTLAESLESRCQLHGIQAHSRNDLPGDKDIFTDVEMVRQIAGVLVNNACRHARQAQEPKVLLHLAAENGYLKLSVIDSGPGVDRADTRRIFKPFRRGRNADATAQGGVGLGLALARNWANLLGGHLDLAARHHPVHGGAHFCLSVPLNADRADSTAHQRNAKHSRYARSPVGHRPAPSDASSIQPVSTDVLS